jgi:hypothetical protein
LNFLITRPVYSVVLEGEAERVSGGVGVDPESLTASGQSRRTKLQGFCFAHVRVVNEDVEVCLLRVRRVGRVDRDREKPRFPDPAPSRWQRSKGGRLVPVA